MGKKHKFPLLLVGAILVILLISLLMHADPYLMVLYPSGWVGIKERNLMLFVSFIMLLVVLPVLVMTVYFGWKYREERNAKYHPDWDYNRLIESIWWGVPCLIIIVFAFWTWRGSHELDPYQPLKSDIKPIRIQVVALQWKWLFIYPEEKIAAVNFFQFPEKTPLYFEISADAPMNSFWLPALGGQIYAMAGMRSKLNLIADHTGVFKGRSANISGKGFAGMVFTAKSSTNEEFNAWVEEVRASGLSLDLAGYKQLALPSSYVPISTYVLGDDHLFDQIVMKYMAPMEMK